MNYKEKALEHVRGVCHEQKSVDYMTASNVKDTLNYIPHLEHWLRGIDKNVANFKVKVFGRKQRRIGIIGWSDEFFITYNPYKDGENQNEEFYKAYCQIVGV